MIAIILIIRYFYEIKVLLRKQFAVIIFIIAFKRERPETSLSSVALALLPSSAQGQGNGMRCYKYINTLLRIFQLRVSTSDKCVFQCMNSWHNDIFQIAK